MTSCRLPLRLLLQIRSLHRLRQPRWWMSRPPPLLFRTLPRRHPPQLPKSHCMSNSNSSSSSRHYRNSSYSNNPPRRCHCPSLALTPSCVLPRPLRLFSPVSPSILPSSPPPASSLPTLPSPAPLLPKLPPVASWPHSPFRRRFRLLDRSNRLPRSRPARRLLPLPRTQPLQIRRESTGHASIQKPVWSSSASKSSTLVCTAKKHAKSAMTSDRARGVSSWDTMRPVWIRNARFAKRVSLAAPTNQRPRAPPARHPSLILMCISPPHMHLTPIPLPGASTQRPATRSYYPTAFCRITLDSCTTNSAESTRMAPRCPSRPRRRRRSIRSICKPISTQPMSAMSATFVARRAPVSAVMVAICTAPARQRAPCPAPWQTIRFRKQTRPTAAGTPFPSARSTPSTSWPLWPTGCAGSISNDSVSLGASIDESCVFGATGAVNGSASFHKRICSPAPRHIG